MLPTRPLPQASLVGRIRRCRPPVGAPSSSHALKWRRRTLWRRCSGPGFAPGTEPGKGRGNGGGWSQGGKGGQGSREARAATRYRAVTREGTRLWVSELELGWRVLGMVWGWCWDLTSIWTVLLWPPREEQAKTAQWEVVTKRRRVPEPRPCDAVTCPFGPLTASNLSRSCCFPGDKDDRVS